MRVEAVLCAMALSTVISCIELIPKYRLAVMVFSDTWQMALTGQCEWHRSRHRACHCREETAGLAWPDLQVQPRQSGCVVDNFSIDELSLYNIHRLTSNKPRTSASTMAMSKCRGIWLGALFPVLGKVPSPESGWLFSLRCF